HGIGFVEARHHHRDQRSLRRYGCRTGGAAMPPSAKLEGGHHQVGDHVAEKIREPEQKERDRYAAVPPPAPQNGPRTRTPQGPPATRCATIAGGGSTNVTSASRKAALGSTGGGAEPSGRPGLCG